MITIALDAMGGDDAPLEIVKGAAQMSLENERAHILLVGDTDVISPLLKKLSYQSSRLSIHHAPDVIPMDANPKEAVEAMPNSSLVVAAKLVAKGDADALVSAGNTGAVIMSCAKNFKRLPGVTRAALGAVYPTEQRRGEKNDPFSLILDVGLTLDVSARDLVGFAVMGSAYASRISKNETPRIALLSNGSEENKGTKAIKEAHQILKGLDDMNFIGNIEGMDIPKGTADVIITDGFTGNIVLKMFEGIASTVMRLGKYAFRKSIVYKAGLTLLAPAVKQLKEVTDWEQYGGAPILGFDRICIKAHGRSSERAIKNALKVAVKTVETDVVSAIRESMSTLSN